MSTRATGTPLMRQYSRIKARHKDAILFFRMGDFYETFFEDAKTAARVLHSDPRFVALLERIGLAPVEASRAWMKGR